MTAAECSTDMCITSEVAALLKFVVWRVMDLVSTTGAVSSCLVGGILLICGRISAIHSQVAMCGMSCGRGTGNVRAQAATTANSCSVLSVIQ